MSTKKKKKNSKPKPPKTKEAAIEEAKSNENKFGKLQVLLEVLSADLQKPVPIGQLTNTPTIVTTKQKEQSSPSVSIQYGDVMLDKQSVYSMNAAEGSLKIKGPLIEAQIQQFAETGDTRHDMNLFRLPVKLVYHYSLSGWKVYNQDFSQNGTSLSVYNPSHYFSVVMGLFKQTKYGYLLFGLLDEKFGNSTTFRCLIDKLGVVYQRFQYVEHKVNGYSSPIACCLCDEYTSNYSLLIWNKPKTKLISVFLHQVSPKFMLLSDKLEQKRLILQLGEAIRQKVPIQRPIEEQRILRPRPAHVMIKENSSSKNAPSILRSSTEKKTETGKKESKEREERK